MKKIRKILITGSSGMIGTRLFEKLLEEKYEVIGFDKKPNIWNSELNKLTIKGDLLRQKDIDKIRERFDLIVHLAANPYVYNSVINPDLAKENVDMTYNILEFARQKKIGKIIFSSSREVYGNLKGKTDFNEKDIDITRCESPYAASKISAETLIYAFSKCYKINYIIFRLSNVYGMYDNSERFVPILLRDMNKNKEIYIYGKNKFLAFTYIDDCIGGIVKGIENFSKAKNNVFNLAGRNSSNLFKLAQTLKRNLQSKSKIIIKNIRTGEVISFTADISKIKKILLWSPKYSIKLGVEKTINWYKINLK